jgi:hypothetical protein
MWYAGHGNDDAWKWHARFGHLNFHYLGKFAAGDMVHGVPHVDMAICCVMCSSPVRSVEHPSRNQAARTQTTGSGTG